MNKTKQCQTCNRSFLTSKMHTEEFCTSHEGSPPFSWSDEFKNMSKEEQMFYWDSITSKWKIWTCNECYRLNKLKE